MTSSQSTTVGEATSTPGKTVTAATPMAVDAAVTLLGKRKEPPMPSPASSPTNNVVVDAAFKRLFGYSWGTTFDLPIFNNNMPASSSSSMERQMVQIFGPTRTARILNLPWDVVAPVSACSNTASTDDYYNPAAMLTTNIVATDATNPTPLLTLSATTAERNSKKVRLEERDYKNIALPNHMISTAPSTTTSGTQGTRTSGPSSAIAPTTKNHNQNTAATTTSKLDSVLSQISGKKQLNTVEKTSNDWEGFKETDKTLQDELERNAQSKNAYLVKQDFLNRVDHRKFELEKEERDRERSRRAASGSK